MRHARCHSVSDQGEVMDGASTRRPSFIIQRSALLLCLIWVAFARAPFPGWATPQASNDGQAVKAGETKAGGDSCIACHSRESGKTGQPVKLHSASAHGKAGIGCHGCHGGDPSQAEKSRAHAPGFVGKPDANGTLLMCGACHQQPLALFKGSRHFPAQRGRPRLDCAECHGVHTVGSAPASFSFATFCAGCHGLEYLPALPPPFQDLLNLSDDLREGLRNLEESGRSASGDLIQRRKEIRRLTSEIVHPTDLKGGLEQIPHLLQLGEALKRQIQSEQNRKP